MTKPAKPRRRSTGRLGQLNKVLRLQCRRLKQLRKYDAPQIYEV